MHFPKSKNVSAEGQSPPQELEACPPSWPYQQNKEQKQQSESLCFVAGCLVNQCYQEKGNKQRSNHVPVMEIEATKGKNLTDRYLAHVTVM